MPVGIFKSRIEAHNPFELPPESIVVLPPFGPIEGHTVGGLSRFPANESLRERNRFAFMIYLFLQNPILPPCSVADPDPNPDPDPPDPHVFGPPGSGSTSQRGGPGSCSGSGSGSFYHHAKIVRKTLVPTIL